MWLDEMSEQGHIASDCFAFLFPGKVIEWGKERVIVLPFLDVDVRSSSTDKKNVYELHSHLASVSVVVENFDLRLTSWYYSFS